TGAFARQARDPVHHLGFDLLAGLAFPRQAEDLRASRPVRPQGVGHRRRDLDRALLDPAVPFVDLIMVCANVGSQIRGLTCLIAFPPWPGCSMENGLPDLPAPMAKKP